MINTIALKRLLRHKKITNNDVAECIGKSVSATSLRINGKKAMTLDEAEKIQHLLNINNEDFAFYFLYNGRTI